MKNISIFLLTAFILTGCTKESYISKKENTLKLNQNGKTLNISLKNHLTHKFNNRVLNGYTADEDHFRLEYISLKSRCKWTGSAEGFYKDFLKSQFKNLKLISSKNSDKFDIYRYEVLGKNFYLISLYDASSNTFIVDYEGQIANFYDDDFPVLENFEILNERLNKSLLDNYFSDFFEKEDSRKSYELIYIKK